MGNVAGDNVMFLKWLSQKMSLNTSLGKSTVLALMPYLACHTYMF